ncbi:ABC transporter permease [Ruegeria atlantica]|uniref:ABC transporter permease n=1 Tax=Ruegeria atlantica TaxID=81569 RepID=UPI001479A7A1|nr:ABC transporter permease [Ruegeria atlantica]
MHISPANKAELRALMVPGAGLVGLGVIFGYLAPNFLTTGNLLNIVTQMSILVLVAIGQSFVLSTRNFDLTLGVVVALASAVCAIAVNSWGSTAYLVAPFVGIVCGMLTGCLVGMLGIQPVVATLGVLIGLRGVAFLVTGSGQVVPLADRGFATWAAYSNVFGLPPATWFVCGLCVLALWIAKRSVLGKKFVMTGERREAAQLVGIRCEHVVWKSYILAGFFAGCAGLVLLLRAGTGLPSEGVGMEMQAIAAAVIGGTLLSGGYLRIFGTIFGVAFLQTLLTGLNLIGTSPFVAQIATGAVILAAGVLEGAVKNTSEVGA